MGWVLTVEPVANNLGVIKKGWINRGLNIFFRLDCRGPMRNRPVIDVLSTNWRGEAYSSFHSGIIRILQSHSV